jgi:hypothetical protein
MKNFRPTKALINLGAIERNTKKLIAKYSGYKYYTAVVKADCYGYRGFDVVRAMIKGGANLLAASLVEEGAALREEFPHIPIMLFNPVEAENLEFMRGKVSDEFLASLSDGSKESAEYLSQMVSALQGANAKEAEEQVAEADRLFQEVQAKKESFIDTLTQQKLAVDETYDALVQKAKEAVAEMDLSGEAGQNATATVSAIAEGLAGGVSEVSAAVSAILAELGRLAKFKIDTSFGGFGGLKLNGSFATGLDYVPFNGFLAELHEGEGILTAEENRLWQRFKNGGETGRNAIDMDALGGVMRDNITPGGNVYLDGRIVGAVVSKAQGESYRALQRSGWQG